MASCDLFCKDCEIEGCSSRSEERLPDVKVCNVGTCPFRYENIDLCSYNCDGICIVSSEDECLNCEHHECFDCPYSITEND